jgi:hypothetical protein
MVQYDASLAMWLAPCITSGHVRFKPAGSSRVGCAGDLVDTRVRPKREFPASPSTRLPPMGRLGPAPDGPPHRLRDRRALAARPPRRAGREGPRRRPRPAAGPELRPRRRHAHPRQRDPALRRAAGGVGQPARQPDGPRRTRRSGPASTATARRPQGTGHQPPRPRHPRLGARRSPSPKPCAPPPVDLRRPARNRMAAFQPLSIRVPSTPNHWKSGGNRPYTSTGSATCLPTPNTRL